ncbi:protein SLOW GREEN 1, chloroplastic-like [Wolffia australiana]
MEAFNGVSHARVRCSSVPFLSRSSPPSFAKPIRVLRPSRNQISIRASISTPRIDARDDSLLSNFSSLVKPACIAVVAGAALFIAGLCRPPVVLAIVPSSPQSARSETLSSPLPDLESLPEEEKMKILEDYLESNPDDVKALRSLMELKIAAQKTPEAIAIVDRLIDLENDHKDLPLLKSHLQIYEGDTETAKLGFEAMLQKDPMLVEAYHGLVMAAWNSEAESDLEGVLDRIRGAMELCKNTKNNDCLRDFKLLVAQVNIVQGNYDEALKVYNDLVKEEPRDFRPYLCQGIVYSMLDKNDEAEKQFQKYRQLVPKEHPYSQYFDENMVAMKVFSQIEENKRSASLSR